MDDGKGQADRHCAASTEHGAAHCPARTGPRGCPGPRGPQGPQPPLSDALDSADRDTAASSLAVKTVYDRTRTRAGDTLVLHVRQDGSDANDGFSETTAKAGIVAALRTLAGYDARAAIPEILVGPGRFAGGFQARSCHSGLRQVLRITGSGPETVLAGNGEGHALKVYDSHSVQLYDMTVQGILYAGGPGELVLRNNMVLEPQFAGRNLVRASNGGRVVLETSSTTIRNTGHAPATFLHASDPGSCIFVSYGPIHFDNVAFDEAVLLASRSGCVHWRHGVAWTGNALGRRFSVGSGGMLACGTDDPDSFLPGSEPGSVRARGLAGNAGAAQVCGHVGAGGNFFASVNIASCTWLEAGLCRVDFFRPASTDRYVVVVVPERTQASPALQWHIADKQPDSLTLALETPAGIRQKANFALACSWT